MIHFLKNLFRLSCFVVVRPVIVRKVLCKAGMVAQYLHFLYRPDSDETSAPAPNGNGSTGQIVVQAGIFKGLIYPGVISFCSVFKGKIYGSYESELSPHLEALFAKRHYNQFVDIGAAEGYYAVGFALKYPDLEIYTFDSASIARKLLKELARANGVEGRIRICAFCTPKTLTVLPWRERPLLLCDCEGYERTLLCDTAVGSLGHCDLVVELHRTEGIDIQAILTQRFSQTHEVRFVPTQTPIEKAAAIREKMPVGMNEAELFDCLNERRQRSFGWLILEAKEHKYE